ncbi:Nucleolar protein 16 [Smittium mucronatum]|uniref:Nucleolar protein 16 n=1 Tax=Smittium mucronatum TaxID=133383 RepID=A0A1R0GS63_9FUNG|nr:Nucleolar protein 16 [Smittium mucronatum]
MANPRQRRLKKNPNLRATKKNQKTKSKKVVFKGHHLLRDDWNKNISVRDNYRNLGLVSKLNGISGGSATKFWNDAPSYHQSGTSSSTIAETADGDADSDFSDLEAMIGEKKYKFTDEQVDSMGSKQLETIIPKGYGLIKRDPAGNILDIVIPNDNDNDENNGDDDDIEEQEIKPVVPKSAAAKKLEEFAATAEKRKVWCSDGHVSFVQQLINKHGLDYDAMFWDKDLNVQQQTPNQLKRRVKQFLKSMQ